MKNVFNRIGFNYMRSKGRAVLHKEILPKFAKYYQNGDLIVNIGTHRFWDYDSYFVNPDLLCEYHSYDIHEVRDQITNEIKGEIGSVYELPQEDKSIDGLLFIGMHDNISDPMEAYRCILNKLKPGGRLLVAFPGSGAKCGGELVGMDSWNKFLNGYIIDEVHYVYDPEDQERYTDGKNTAILVIARRPRD